LLNPFFFAIKFVIKTEANIIVKIITLFKIELAELAQVKS
jgi:hypothetical protein